jgi:hypothetical protein
MAPAPSSQDLCPSSSGQGEELLCSALAANATSAAAQPQAAAAAAPAPGSAAASAASAEGGSTGAAGAAMSLPCGHAFHRDCLLQWLQQCYG